MYRGRARKLSINKIIDALIDVNGSQERAVTRSRGTVAADVGCSVKSRGTRVPARKIAHMSARCTHYL